MFTEKALNVDDMKHKKQACMMQKSTYISLRKEKNNTTWTSCHQ